MRKKLLPTITTTIYMILGSYAHADTYTHEVPMQGCYRNNGNIECVEVTTIKCVVWDSIVRREERETRLADNVRLYGPVIASMCDDLQFVINDNLSLRKKLKNLQNKNASLR